MSLAARVRRRVGRRARPGPGLDVPVGRLDYEPAEIYLRTDTRAEALRLRSCRKEPWTVEWIERWMRPGDVLYDIGANVGAYSLVAAKQPAELTIVAFEPGYANYAALCDNLVLNGVDAVIPLPIALSDRTEIVDFSYRKVEAGGGVNLIDGHAEGEAGFEPRYRQPLLAYRLDDLIAAFDLPLPNHVKIDVESGEPAVIAGAERTLRSPSLRSLMVEVRPSAERELVEACERSRLVLRQRFRGRKREKVTEHWYGLFASSDLTEGLAAPLTGSAPFAD